MNIITTVGNLTADPTLATTSGGQQVCKFRLAAQTKRKDPETNQYLANFYNCTVWGKAGEIVSRYFKKGNRIMVSGDLVLRDYTDKNGTPRVSVDIDVRDWDFGGSNNGSQAQQPAQTQTAANPAAPAQGFSAPSAYNPQQAYAQPPVAPQNYVQPAQYGAFQPPAVMAQGDLPF